jgi:hypothetical protein
MSASETGCERQALEQCALALARQHALRAPRSDLVKPPPLDDPPF